ncbi:diguanylate cyclase [Kineococcus sp. SYSU DK006]|uniref:GGDEF domain-containing protein n=1 Tax=Kineococcus sp. SYSU DK006 TaxID=3383127 RepID=UPI003D7C68AA
MTSVPGRAARPVRSVRSGLARAAAALGREGRWVAVAVGAMLASTALGLWWLVAHAPAVSLEQHRPLAVLAASAYSALALAVLVRRRIGRRLGAVLVGALLVLMLAEGTAYPEPSLRWVCLAFLTVLPLLAVVVLGRGGAALTTIASVAVVLVVVQGLPGTPQVRTYVASTMVSLVCVPVLVVGVLLAQLERTRCLAQRMASTDPLTGLLNRRGLHERLPALLAQAARTGRQVALAVVDVDHFKRVNDEHGHLVGDQVLVQVAAALTRATRADDLLVRLGGEEIAWVAPHRDPGEAVGTAERARRAVAGARADGLPPVTVSLGVAVSGPLEAGADPLAVLDDLLARADAALYRAKATGRDRVHVAGPVHEPS